MKIKQFRMVQRFSEEQGSAMMVAIVMLIILTIIGIAAIKTSSLENLISGSEKKKRAAFYAAEAGIEHGKAILKRRFREVNGPKAAALVPMDWTFALDGTETVDNNGAEKIVNAATKTSFDGAAIWLQNIPIGRYTYSVRVWNNPNEESPTNDTDALIHVRAVAESPGEGRSGIEISLMGGFMGPQGIIAGYTAQAGAGSGKNYNSNDANAIADFNKQLP